MQYLVDAVAIGGVAAEDLAYVLVYVAGESKILVRDI